MVINPEVYTSRAPEEAGGIWVFANDDNNLRISSSPSGFLNLGQKGYLVVVIHDGKRWCRLTKGFLESIGVSDTVYRCRAETLGLKCRIARRIEHFIAHNPNLKFKFWPYQGKWYAKPTDSTLPPV